MKKLFSSLSMFLLIMLFALSANAQLTGTKNIPGDYATLEAAITDLNTQGVGTGGVLINVLAGNPQNAPAGGYVIGGTGSLVLTSTSIAKQVNIQGNGNTITASNALVAGNLNDGIFKLIGADWISILGFTMNENPANTTTAAGTNNMTEWGVALLYVTTTDGAQHNTIFNNIIDLNRTYQNTFGIYSNSTHSATAVTTSVTATTINGGNSYLNIYSNSITDVNNGITVVGPTAAADQNDSINIGGAAVVANFITNYGTTGTFSGYANVSGTVNGVLIRNTRNFNASYNTIASSNGGTTVGTLRGIFIPAFSATPAAGTFSHIITNNIISVRSAVAAGALQGIIEEGTTASTTSILNISNNDFNTITHTVAASGVITLISNAGTHQIVTINNNTFTNLTVNTTGSVTFITNSVTRPANSVCNVNNNSIVTGFSKTGAGGTVLIYDSFGSSPITGSETNIGNNFSNITLTGATAFSGWRCADGSGTSPFGTSKTIRNNTFNNITGGTGAINYILNVGYGNNNTANDVYNNTITNITGGGSIIGLQTTVGTQNFYDNTISGLSSTGAAAVTGMSMAGANLNIYRNKVYNLQSNNAGGSVSGATISGAITLNFYNNLIGDLRALISTGTVDAVRGINLTSTTAASNLNVSYNSIYINAASSGAEFHTSGIFQTVSATSTVATLNLRNNLIVNLSTPNGAGITSAYRRSGTALNNYGSSSNNNLFYAGTPGANRLIFYDGTNSDQTLNNYKIRVSPRDLQSITENPNFRSTTGSSPDFLHIDSTITTQIESGASTVAGITTDYDGIPRYPNAGYPNNLSFPAFAPDIGADEFGGIPQDMQGPSINYTALANIGNTSNRTLTASITDPAGVAGGANVPRLYYKKSTEGVYHFDNAPLVAGSNYTWTIDNSQMGGVTAGDIIQYYVAAQDNIGNMATLPFGGSGSNPPGTTAPGAPNSYTVTAASLAGDYTVGTTLFNLVTGKNITFEERVRTIMREVPVETDQIISTPEIKEKGENSRGHNPLTEVDHLSVSANVKTEMVEVEEKYYVAVEKGVEYKGALSHEFTKEEKVQFGLPDNLLGVYATITAAVTDLNLRGVSGHTNFILTDATYTGETFPITVTVGNANVPTSSRVVTFKPGSGVVASVTGASASSGMFRVINTNYVTIDGSNNGTTTRDLTFTNTSTTGPNVIHFGSSGTTPITNLTVKNCILINGANTSTAVVVSDAVVGSAGYFNNVTIQNNSIQRAYIGNYNIVVVSPGNGSGLLVTGNDINTSGANAIRLAGIYVQGVDGAVVSNNNIANFEAASAEIDRGIWFATATINSTMSGNNISILTHTGAGSGVAPVGITVTSGIETNANVTVIGNYISNISSNGTGTTSGMLIGAGFPLIGCNVRSNTIANIKNSNTGGYGANAIQLGSTSVPSNINVTNNSISDIAAYGFAGSTPADNGYGIVITSGGNYNLWYNSVNMNTDQTATTGLPAALNVVAATTGLDIRNNIFANSQTIGTERYAIYSTAANTVYSDMNYNVYFTAGPNLGFIGGSNRATLANMIAGFGGNLNSLSGNPTFTSPTNLLPDNTNPNCWILNGTGIPISSVNNDIQGNGRSISISNGTTDIGAFEFTTGTMPPAATQSGTIGSGNTTTYSLFGKTFCSLVWGGAGVYPGTITARNYSGVTPPNPTGGARYGFGYWDISPDVQPSGGATYDIILNFGDNQTGTVQAPNTNTVLAKYDGATWVAYMTGGISPTILDWAAKTARVNGLTSFSQFALTDNAAPLPVELASFTSVVNRNEVKLNWTTSMEENNSGFDIERKIGSSETWSKIGNVTGNGTTSETKNYSFSDKGLNTGKYNYRLKQIDFNGNFKYFTLSSEVIVGVPADFKLSQNYPNPFNPTTKIDYDLPVDSKVNLRIYDMLGREVASLVNEQVTAGYYTVQLNGVNFASGTYFFRLVAQGTNGKEFVMTKKMQLIK